MIRRITVDGYPATEQAGMLDGNAVVRVVVPAARAIATTTAPHLDAAQQIAATLSVVDHDSNGCPSQSAYRSLTAGAAPVRPGADQTLVHGNPASLAVCGYDGNLLAGGATVPTGDVPADLRLLLNLPVGLSIASAANTAHACTAPNNPAVSLDRAYPRWFGVLVHYRSGPDLMLRARAGNCGYLGISNGSVTGQDLPELTQFLLTTSPTGGAYPQNVTPVR